jgi:hypothetical protein
MEKCGIGRLPGSRGPIHSQPMETELDQGALFDPASELRLIQLLFPNLNKNEQSLLLKLRATTQLLTRGVNANLEKMDANFLARHEHFIREHETRWVALQQQIRESGLLQKLMYFQAQVFESEFGKVTFKGE